MKIRFIINPRSGGGQRYERCRAAIAKFMATHRIAGDIVVTNASGHATALAKQAVRDDFSHVACVGGDGTLNEIAQALVHQRVVLVIIPNGSGNGLARHLRIPLSLSASLDLLLSKESGVSRIDTGSINGRLFCNVAGTGFDADVALAFNGMAIRGLLGYMRAILSYWIKRKPRQFLIASDGISFHAEALLIAIANSDQYGNNARVAPGASVQDGMLDLVIVPGMPGLKMLPLIIWFLIGRIDKAGGVRRVSGFRFTIIRGDEEPIHVDGEVHVERKLLEIEVCPSSLSVLQPVV